jgi:hypothetical protein
VSAASECRCTENAFLPAAEEASIPVREVTLCLLAIVSFAKSKTKTPVDLNVERHRTLQGQTLAEFTKTH